MPEVDRHPLYVAYHAQLERENTRCLLRASARNKMKRFITDVHTVWLTNLAHHPEFRRTVRGAFSGGENDLSCDGDAGQTVRGVSDGEDNIPSGGGGGGGGGAGNHANPLRAGRRGLDGGRDSAAIAASQSQIQSVQTKRAFREAFYYTSKSAALPPRTAANDELGGGELGRGAAQEKPTENDAREYPRVDKDNTQVGIDFTRVDNEGGESPELPPPPVTPPTLAVLARERRRIGPVITSGGNRRSIGSGGGVVRKSIGGGFGETNSSLESRTVLLRVLRFAPSLSSTTWAVGTAPCDTVSAGTASRATKEVSGVAGSGSDATGVNLESGPNGFVGDDPLPGDDSSRVVTANNAISEKEDDAAAAAGMMTADVVATPPLRSNIVVQQAQPKLPQEIPAPEATWLISSFCPYDGSETGILIGDEAVAKRVGEVLSALTPVAAPVELSDSRNDASSRNDAWGGEPAGAGWGGEGRLRLLRSGVRVPALAADGHVVGTVLSVVEVSGLPKLLRAVVGSSVLGRYTISC